MIDFNKWYKKKLEFHAEDPPAELWDAIQNDLDVELVWGRLNADLTPVRTYSLYFKLAVAASLLLLAALCGWYFISLQHHVTPVAFSDQPVCADRIEFSVDQEGHYKAPTKTFEPALVLPHAISTKKPTADNLPTGFNLVIAEIVSINEFPEWVFESDWWKTPSKIAVSYNNRLPLIEFENDIILVAHTKENPVADPMYLDSKNNFSEVIFGVSFQVANTWLLNDKTLNELSSSDQVSTSFSFGQNIGVKVGTNLGNNNRIWLDYHFISQSRQRYSEFLNGQYVSNTIELEYHSLSFLWQHQLKENESPHRISAGLYLGLLRNAEQNTNGLFLDTTKDYEKLDKGLVIGYDYQYEFIPSFSLSGGIYGKLGLTNINSVKSNRTQNAALILSLSLNYHFRY